MKKSSFRCSFHPLTANVDGSDLSEDPNEQLGSIWVRLRHAKFNYGAPVQGPSDVPWILRMKERLGRLLCPMSRQQRVGGQVLVDRGSHGLDCILEWSSIAYTWSEETHSSCDCEAGSMRDCLLLLFKKKKHTMKRVLTCLNPYKTNVQPPPVGRVPL